MILFTIYNYVTKDRQVVFGVKFEGIPIAIGFEDVIAARRYISTRGYLARWNLGWLRGEKPSWHDDMAVKCLNMYLL